MTKNSKILCALDTPSVKQAQDLILQIKDYVYGIKLGLEFFVANGASGVREIAKMDIPIFLDLKLHDIPNTVSKAITEAAKIENVFMITIHSLGGIDMMRKAKDTIDDLVIMGNIAKPPLIIGVTILTSLSQTDIADIGIHNNINSQILQLADIARQSRLDGVVCSPLELEILRQKFPLKASGDHFKLIVPGIRDLSDAKGDQTRVMNSSQAIERGADFIVIGRPITQASNPREKVQDIYNTCIHS